MSRIVSDRIHHKNNKWIGFKFQILHDKLKFISPHSILFNQFVTLVFFLKEKIFIKKNTDRKKFS
jgi:hypothetical protein